MVVGVQIMRMKRVGGFNPYEEQEEDYVDKGESVESALKIGETGCGCECEGRESVVWLICVRCCVV